jgi:hypothetical protein
MQRRTKWIVIHVIAALLFIPLLFITFGMHIISNQIAEKQES